MAQGEFWIFDPQANYSLLDVVAPEAKVRAPVEMVGWALAGPSGIRRVDVSTDDGQILNAAELSVESLALHLDDMEVLLRTVRAWALPRSCARDRRRRPLAAAERPRTAPG